MGETYLIGIASVFLFGVGSQWVAWKFKLPSILLLLLAGIAAGPLLGLVNPDELMGGLLTPFISVSVAIILFEGGLSLSFSELKNVGTVIGNLVSIGVLVTWVILAFAAHYIIGIGWELSILIGAVLVVTGPTVIVPLLRQVRPSGQAGSILKWEGIVIDPIGAMLAVLVFEVILASGVSEATNLALMSIVKTIVFGTLVGLGGAAVIYFLLKRHLLPDYLQNPVSLMIVILVFTLSNMLQHESGLWATTLMGIALANQKSARIHHIIEFKENLRVLLLSALFILLAARVELEMLINTLDWDILAFLAVVIVVARPLSVFLSSIGSTLKREEKLFLSVMAPRGVVAASISSIFAISLAENGFEEAGQVVSVVFITIISTVAIYGLSANWVARKLGVAKPVPNGVLILGGHSFARNIAEHIDGEEFKVLVADNNWKNIERVRSMEINSFHGNILSDYVLEDLDLDGIGRLLCLTPNDEVNSLAALRFGEIFGRSYVFQLPPTLKQDFEKEKRVPDHLNGRILFGPELNFEKLTQIMKRGGEIRSRVLEADDAFTSAKEGEEHHIPLFLVGADHEIQPFTADNPPVPREGDKIIYLAVPSSIDLNE